MPRPIFVAIGDIHARAGHPRNADRLAALDQIIDVGLTIDDLGAWLVLGDVFDARSQIDDRNELAHRFVTMANHAPVIIAQGNHDLPGDLAIFGRLAAKHTIHVCESPEIVHLHNIRTAIFVLPYPNAGALVAGGLAPSEIPGAAGQALDAICIDIGHKLAERRAHGGWRTLMIGHVTVVGAVASTGQPQLHLGLEVEPTMLSHLGTWEECPKILGHIHKPQSVGGARYAGSISRNDYGEIEDKGWLRIEWTDGQGWLQWQHSLNVPAMWHVEAEYQDLIDDEPRFTYTVTAGPGGPVVPAPDTWEGCDVRVRVRHTKSQSKAFAAARPDIERQFAGAVRLLIEPVCVPDRAMRAPEVAAARSLTDKVQAWAKLDGAVVDADVLQLLAQLDTEDGEQLLVTVAREVEGLVKGQEVVA